MWGIDGHVNEVPHAGSTDPLIMRDVLLHHGVSPPQIWAKMPEAISVASGIINEHMRDCDLRPSVLPGVHELLRTLSEVGVMIGLVTGNLEEIGWCKMEAAGLRGYFGTGAFSGVVADRGEILRNCIMAAEGLEGGAWFTRKVCGDGKGLGNVFHVGDATSDMRAAKSVGARGIGVTTGVFERGQLEGEEAYCVLEGLQDTKGFLKLIDASDE